MKRKRICSRNLWRYKVLRKSTIFEVMNARRRGISNKRLFKALMLAD